MTRLAFSVGVAALVTSLALYTNAAAVTVLYVLPDRLDVDGNPMPTPMLTAKPSVFLQQTMVVSAVGPVESGLTKYEVKRVESGYIYSAADKTETLDKPPRTIIFNVEQGDGKILRIKGDPSVEQQLPDGSSWSIVGTDLECTLDDAKERGVCIGANLHADLTTITSGTQTVVATQTESIGTTFTGDVVPFATLSSGAAHSLSVPYKALIAALVPVAFGAFVLL
ncbi:hypothetical protein CVT24_010145 [Panaeolus cyanescens]|uniref:Uncharacterized protein n=1 Tax=Panaeolus cyanescens TaxID=181874 RepID=A0A409W986_9AGAR|nr:hypothetical protein CVT24_010145 [Panaeolus cyanescens]